jgi:hypothetical protein
MKPCETLRQVFANHSSLLIVVAGVKKTGCEEAQRDRWASHGTL